MTQPISDRTHAFMAAWHSRQPGFALMGEYSSGKSALLNALLGQDLVPTRVTATDLPAIWLTHGPAQQLRGLGHDGTLVDLAPEDLTAGEAMRFFCIRIETPSALLQRCDIIDTPGISDPRMTTDIVEAIARHVDFAVWCSPLNQAWRQTERAFWAALPARIKSESILALTRADMMRGPQDIDKVVRRCQVETAGSFAAILPVAATLVRPGGDPASGPDRSGMPALRAQLMQAIIAVEPLCAARERLREPGPVVATAAERKPVKAGGKAAAKLPGPARGAVSKGKLKLDQSVRVIEPGAALDGAILAEIRALPATEAALPALARLSRAIEGDLRLASDHRAVLLRALSAPPDFAGSIDRLRAQVRQEAEDFAQGAWCALGG